jgi:ATP-binding cassette subfamily F protein 3
LFDGDLEDYKSWIETRRPSVAVAAPEKPRVQTAAKPNRKALQSKQGRLETALAAAQAELATVNLQLADPVTYASPDRARISELNAAHARLEAKVGELEESWLELEIAIGE